MGWWELDAASVAGCPSSRASLAFLDLSLPLVSIGRWGAFGAPAFIEGGRVVVMSSPSPRLPANPPAPLSSSRVASPRAEMAPTAYIFAPDILTNFVLPFLFILYLFVILSVFSCC